MRQLNKSIYATIVVFLGMLLSDTITAQNTNCYGLKNPTNFTLYNSPMTGQYTGKLGEKPYTASNCNNGTVGMSFTTDVPNNQLATVTSSQSASDCGSFLNNETRFRIMHNTDGPGTGINQGKDPLTNYALPYCPEGYTSSVRVGNCRISKEAEALYYTLNINNNNKLIFINYAIVVQAPGHGVTGDPEFVIRVTRQNNAGQWVPISDTLCYVVSSTPTSNGGTVTIGQDGWHSLTSGYEQVYYRDWNQVVINLSKYYTQTVRIECMIGDCAASGHFGYCYIAGDCAPMALDANGCAAGSSNRVATIAAPSGLAGYKWYRSTQGVLSGAARENRNNYSEIIGETDDTLDIMMSNYIINGGQDTLNQNTFMCEMTSYMDPTKPIKSALYTDVGNKKPAINVDTVLQCDASVTMINLSYTPFDANKDSNKVDTNNTHWKFYSSTQPTEQTLVHEATGARATYQYPDPGNYCVVITTSAYDTSCWNEKTVPVRAIKSPRPRIRFERNNLCSGDTISIYDETQGATWHQWTMGYPEGDTTYVSAGSATRATFTDITPISLLTHTNTYFLIDTTGDGILDRRYCHARLDTSINVGQYPELTISGDTIVCYGTQANLNVTSSVDSTTFDWYSSTQSNNPLQANSATLTTSPTHDIRYFVKARSPYNCESWDSVKIHIVDPHLEVPVTEICDNTSISLYASNAFAYTWTAMPDDPSLIGQEHNETITVTPHSNTTYTLVGHGMNNCTTAPLTEYVKVYPFPVPAVEMTPGFIDSEDPTVTFRDVSAGATTSLWDFGGGHTSTDRQVRHTFTDLSQDSILISLTTGNELQCTNDTSFWVPVELFSVWFPNVFTPTMNTNRTFGCFTHNKLEYYSLYIYNREGLQVFYSADPEAEWDGQYKGAYCPQGVYVYTCTYRRPGTTDIVTQRGTVMLLQ